MELILRDTLNHGQKYVHAAGEYTYEANGTNRTIIPYSPDWKRIMLQTSGGLDSSLLLYLTARTFIELGLKSEIVPFSVEVPNKVKNLESARAVIETVREAVGYDFISKGVEVIMPESEMMPPKKNQFFNSTIMQFIENEGIDFEFNGNTKNPPLSARSHFPHDYSRELTRDHRPTIYNATISACPHAMNDKSGIVFLYKKFGLIESLAPLTLSCDINLDKMQRKGWGFPCGNCWWCHERAWVFASNNIDDPSLRDN